MSYLTCINPYECLATNPPLFRQVLYLLDMVTSAHMPHLAHAWVRSVGSFDLLYWTITASTVSPCFISIYFPSTLPAQDGLYLVTELPIFLNARQAHDGGVSLEDCDTRLCCAKLLLPNKTDAYKITIKLPYN